MFEMRRFSLKKQMNVEFRKQYLVKVSNISQALENLNKNMDSNGAWGSIRINIKISAKNILRYYNLKKNKSWFVEECSCLI